jgi:hypothetical protein
LHPFRLADMAAIFFSNNERPSARFKPFGLFSCVWPSLGDVAVATDNAQEIPENTER